MKQVLLFSLLLVLTACGKPDKEAILGNWKFQDMYQDGKLVSTIDKSKQTILIDSIIDLQGEMMAQQGVTEDFMRKQIKMGFEQVEKVTFVIDSKSLKFTVPEQKEKVSIDSYKLNEETKKIIFENEKDPFFSGNLSYEFVNDLLILKSTKEKMILKRKN